MSTNEAFVIWATGQSSPVCAGLEWTDPRVLDLRAAFEAGQATERERLLSKMVPMAEAQSHNGEYSVGYSRGWNAACGALLQA
jgi:hypothetical protein